jgi:phosphatidylinositol alpha-1,6-mannosyltransferase
MKILFMTRKYPPVVGGMELFAYELSQALADKTDVALVKWAGTGRAKAVLIGIPSVSCRAFFRLLRGGIDVVHAQDGLLAPSAYLLSKLFRKPFAVTIHGLDITYTNPLFKALVPWAVSRADTVFCISEAAAREAEQRGVPADRMQVIPLAVGDVRYGKSDPAHLIETLGIPAENRILLTVGRLEKRKGVAWFIDKVLPGLIKENPRLTYLVIGAGHEQENIEQAMERQKLQEHVLLAGRVDDDTLTAAYNGADIFVMPNIVVSGDMEGFGLVLLEAALCERPVVAADTEGIKDAVRHDRNGVLVPSEDAQAFHNAITTFLKDPAAARRFGKASRTHTLEHHQWPKIADRYITAYKRLQSR